MVYKGCDIGSAKPDSPVLLEHHHHLVNHVTLDEVFSAADFCTSATNLIFEIHDRQKIPLLVGGTMMYFNLLKNGINVLPSADRVYRVELERRVKNKGIASLYVELQELDIEAAENIKPQDTQRIIRALEVIYLSGKTLRENINDSPPSPLSEKYNLLEYGIFPDDRVALHGRIKERQHGLIGRGLLEEVKALVDLYNPPKDHPAMKAINYKQALQVINGELPEGDLFKKSLYATRQLAKRQCTWMRGWDNLNTFDIHEFKKASELLKKQLNLTETI